jgi:hypothetical protein
MTHRTISSGFRRRANGEIVCTGTTAYSPLKPVILAVCSALILLLLSSCYPPPQPPEPRLNIEPDTADAVLRAFVIAPFMNTTWTVRNLDTLDREHPDHRSLLRSNVDVDMGVTNNLPKDIYITALRRSSLELEARLGPYNRIDSLRSWNEEELVGHFFLRYSALPSLQVDSLLAFTWEQMHFFETYVPSGPTAWAVSSRFRYLTRVLYLSNRTTQDPYTYMRQKLSKHRWL